MALYTLPTPRGYHALNNLLTVDARSPWLLQGDAPPAQPGEQQPFPSTAVDLIAALGATGVILPANVLAIYLADTASPLVDSLGLGPNLVANGAPMPLTGRECVGMPTTSFNAKVGCEAYGGFCNFAEAAPSNFSYPPDGTVKSFLLVYRTNPLCPNARDLMGNIGGGPAAWWVNRQLTGPTQVDSLSFIGGSTVAAPDLGAWSATVVILESNGAQVRQRIVTLLADSGVGAWAAGSWVDAAARFMLFGRPNFAADAQCAYLASVGQEITAAMLASFWRAFNLNAFNTPVAYTRAGPLVTRVTWLLGNVACYGANQPAVAYAANASTGDNALKTSIVCEDAVTFLGLGSTNMPAYVGTNATVTATTGPSGMMDACRVADTDGVNAGYATSGAAVLAGATNVPFVFSAYVKSGGVGTNAVFQSYFTGDAGGPELIQNWAIVGAVSAAWRPFIGGVITPVRAAHTAVVTYLIPTDNVGASLGTVDFAEVWGVQNSTVDRLAWRRVDTGAAAATGAQTLSVTNVGNARYSPARGRLRLRISGLQTTPDLLTRVGDYATGGSPHGVAVDKLNQVWIANAGSDTVSCYDAVTKGLIGTYATGDYPWEVAVDTLGQVWITNRNDDTVTCYNAATKALIGTYATGDTPWDVVVNGNMIWISNFVTMNITVYNATTKALIGTVAMPVGPVATGYMTVDGSGNVWVAGGTHVVVFSPAYAVLVNAITHTSMSEGIAYDGSSTVYIAGWPSSVIAVWSTATLAWVSNVACGTNPFAIACDMYGKTWVTNGAAGGSIDIISGLRYDVGLNPQGVAIDGLGQIWISNLGSNTVTCYGYARSTLLQLGAAGTAGALVVDYMGNYDLDPLSPILAGLRVRLWDDLAALVCELIDGTLTAAEAIRTIEWDAAVGKATLLNGATVLASYVGVWVPEANAITPLYIGSAAGVDPARCMMTLLELWNR